VSFWHSNFVQRKKQGIQNLELFFPCHGDGEVKGAGGHSGSAARKRESRTALVPAGGWHVRRN